MFSRFDVPDVIAELFSVGIKLELLDVKDVYALSSEFGENWDDLVNEVVEYGYVRRHSDGGESHRAIVEVAEKIWAMKLMKLSA